jgi:hypothetical protein
MERLLHCGLSQAATVQQRKKRHENLSADAVDRRTFDRDSLHFRAGAGFENASAIAGLLKA